jgi:prepilin-type N-terminal cleavage/methylation domain-containing protein
MVVKKLSSQGFTLPELLLVAAILGYALSMMLLTFIQGLALNEGSRNLITATSHAEYVLENIKNTVFPNLATNISAGAWTWNTSAVTSNGLTALNWENISTTSSGANPLDITVTVSWQDTGGRSRSKVLRTLVSG